MYELIWSNYIRIFFKYFFAQHLKWHVCACQSEKLRLAVGSCCFGFQRAAERSRQRQVVCFSQAKNTQRWLFFLPNTLKSPEKTCLFINNFDMTPIPLKTMTWSLEFNQQPSTKFFSFYSFFTWDRCPNGPCVALHFASKQVQFLNHGEGDMQYNSTRRVGAFVVFAE